MNMLLKTQRLLRKYPHWSGRAFFRNEDYNDPTCDHSRDVTVIMSTAVWKDLGSVEEITVTIEPGDKLNGQEDR